MNIKLAVIGLAALGGAVLMSGAASAMPNGLPQAGHIAGETSNVDKVRQVCDRWGRCYLAAGRLRLLRTAPSRMAPSSARPPAPPSSRTWPSWRPPRWRASRWWTSRRTSPLTVSERGFGPLSRAALKRRQHRLRDVGGAVAAAELESA